MPKRSASGDGLVGCLFAAGKGNAPRQWWNKTPIRGDTVGMRQTPMPHDLPYGGQLGRVVRQRNVDGIGFVEASYARGLRLPTHRHADAHFCFMLAGSVHEETSRSAATHRRNALLFRRAGEVHAQQYGDEGARCFSFFLPAEWNERHGAFPHQSDSFTGSGGSRINALVRGMYSEFRDPDVYSAMAMEGLALELVAETSRSGRRPKAAWLREARARLEVTDASEAVRIDTLASELKVDAGHLVRSFRRAYGVSPAAFVRARRLDAAYQLVVDSDSPLCDIALTTGFFDQSHFTRAFVAHFGVTPGALRRSR